VSVSSREIDAEVNRRIRGGEPLYLIDTELIAELAPDLVITQAHCDVCAVTPKDVERSGCQVRAAQILALQAGSLEGIFHDIGAIGKALGMEREARALICRERQRLARVSERTAGLRRPSLVMIEWTDPIFAMGNWGPELVEFANGDLRIGAKGQYSCAIAPERVLEADPESLIVAPCGFNLERALRELPVLEAFPWWKKLRAVQAGKVAFADGNLFFNRSGTTISQTAEIIAEILHGVTFETPAEGVYWSSIHSLVP
jgi:iron complex transport system substrate-binding protein